MTLVSRPMAAIGPHAAAALDRVARSHGWRRYALALFAGVLATLSMAPFYLFFLIVIAYGLLFTLISVGDKSIPAPCRNAFLTGLAFGFGYFLSGLYWLAFAFLVQAEEFAWMIPIAIPVFSAFLALFFALPCLAYGWLADRLSLIPRSTASALVFAVLISVFEWLRGHILTGLPWNLTGQASAFSPALMQSAALWGVYALGLIILVFSLLPFTRRARALKFLTSLGVFLLLFLAGLLRLPAADTLPTSDVDISIVQPSIPQRDKYDPAKVSANFEKLLSLSRQAANANGRRQIMVWPENAVAFLARQPYALSRIAAMVPERVILLTGTIHADGDSISNAMAVVEPVDGERAVSAVYRKHHLVPFGEYLPLKGLLTTVGLSQLAPVEDGFTPGPGPQTLSVGPLQIAPLICYEGIFPGQLYPAGDRPDALITSTNDAWFGDGAGPRQHLDQARLRAIESGLPMARSANTGISALIDPFGRVIETIPLYEPGFIVRPLPLPIREPVYSRFGDSLYFLIVVGLLGAAFMLRGRAA